MSLTPIFYSPHQVADHAFISIQKLPAFVKGANRQVIEPVPFTEEDFSLAHEATYVQKILNLRTSNGFGTRSASINLALAFTLQGILTSETMVIQCTYTVWICTIMMLHLSVQLSCMVQIMSLAILSKNTKD